MLLPCDIAQEDEGGRLTIVGNDAGTHVHVDPPAILVQDHRLVTGRNGLSPYPPLVKVHDTVMLFWRTVAHELCVEQFLHGVAQHSSVVGVHESKAGILNDGYADVGIFDDPAKLFFAFSQGFLSLLLLGDVDHQAVEMGQRALIVKNRRRPNVDPSPLTSSFAEDTELLVKGRAGFQRAAVGFHNPCQVIGVDLVKPGGKVLKIGDAQQLFHGGAGKNNPSQEGVGRISGDPVDGIAPGALHQRAHMALTLPQCFLHPPALGYFLLQALVGFLKFGGPLQHPQFQILVGFF